MELHPQPQPLTAAANDAVSRSGEPVSADNSDSDSDDDNEDSDSDGTIKLRGEKKRTRSLRK